MELESGNPSPKIRWVTLHSPYPTAAEVTILIFTEVEIRNYLQVKMNTGFPQDPSYPAISLSVPRSGFHERGPFFQAVGKIRKIGKILPPLDLRKPEGKIAQGTAYCNICQ